MSHSHAILTYFERNVGRRMLVLVDRDYGFEGKLAAVSKSPLGIWLTDVDAVIVRGTLANPIPQVISRERKSELYIHLDSILRIEIMPESKS